MKSLFALFFTPAISFASMAIPPSGPSNLVIKASLLERPQVDRCTLAQSPGPCRGYFPRYWYNQATKTCEEFIYGGCQGNKNNFKTLAECESACSTGPGTQKLTSDG